LRGEQCLLIGGDLRLCLPNSRVCGCLGRVERTLVGSDLRLRRRDALVCLCDSLVIGINGNLPTIGVGGRSGSGSDIRRGGGIRGVAVGERLLLRGKGRLYLGICYSPGIVQSSLITIEGCLRSMNGRLRCRPRIVERGLITIEGLLGLGDSSLLLRPRIVERGLITGECLLALSDSCLLLRLRSVQGSLIIRQRRLGGTKVCTP
jgi:hypothetical protein